MAQRDQSGDVSVWDEEMKSAVYFDLGTGDAFEISSGPDDVDFEAPIDGAGILVIPGIPSLPGYVKDGQYITRPDRPGPEYVWQSRPVFNWVYNSTQAQRALQGRREGALSVVDEEAGRARLRYITSVPGQAETYTRKEQQARDWAAAGFAGAPPSFIAAEAAALEREPHIVAQEIIDLADYWGDVKGPQIEATRRKWKVRIAAAESVDAINALQADAIDDLAGL